EEDIRRGFVTMPGGHRVGVAGRVVLSETGAIRTIRSITSVNVRIAREHVGAANRVKTHLWRRDGDRPFNTLVISPPQCGKTTLLRDVVRQWSEGSGTPSGRGVKVVVVDERSEIAGCLDGIPQFCIGPRTDVLDGCPKAEGMLMAIRSLSPDLVVTDEIGRAEDRDAILEATHAGVSVVASAHAAGLEEWRARPYMRELFAARAFQRYVVLSRRLGPCTLEQILDADGNLVRSGNPVRSADSRTRAEPPC
ncbi:MAG: stage III sporulation protein AA, partial [Alicyclobacillaceae bacterium]|nr:stage III sporulation protein AA [Alicyclobacillaceae bacterium]